jgi:hypothetical protein
MFGLPFQARGAADRGERITPEARAADYQASPFHIKGPSQESVMRYTLPWRNKWLTAHARSIDDMVGAPQGAAAALRAMRDKGVAVSEGGVAPDDYVCLGTDDPAVAREFGFEEEDDRDGEGEEDVGLGVAR